jgi:hypothetical protein
VGWCLIAAMQRGALSRPLTGLLSIGTGGKLMDELVKRLRHSANFAERGLIPPPSELREAADAIEQLSNAGSIYGKAWTLGYDAGRDENRPRWIPSEDCLPTIGDEIITLGPNGGMDCGHYKGLSGTRRDKWNWKQHTVKTVKYWLPRKSLPQPPKEDKP